MRATLWLALLSSGGCFALSGSSPQTFIISELRIPENNDDELSSNDLDGDGELDNSLNGWVNAASFLGLDIQQQLTEKVTSGEYLFGLEFDRRSRSDIEFSMFQASATSTPRFDGSDQVSSTSEVFSFSDVLFDSQSLRGSIRERQSAIDRIHERSENEGIIESFINRERIIDSIKERNPEENPTIDARGATLDWLLFPFGVGDLLTVPLRESRVEGVFNDDQTKLEGKITGYVNMFDAARLMEQAPTVFDAVLEADSIEFGGGAPVSCEGNDQGVSNACRVVSPESFCSDRIQDQSATGVCVTAGSTSAQLLDLMDENKDGHWSVDFDEASGLFIENELRLIFNLSEGNSPFGAIGSLFDLDLNADGIKESMPIGVHFTAVRANQE
jgi:hypothetical protein